MKRVKTSYSICPVCRSKGHLLVTFPPDDYVGGLCECPNCKGTGYIIIELVVDADITQHDAKLVGKRAAYVILDDIVPY